MLRVVNKHGAFSLFIKLCYKTRFFYWNTCRLPKSPYLCTVFFIVLDFKGNKGWSTAVLLFLCPYVSYWNNNIIYRRSVIYWCITNRRFSYLNTGYKLQNNETKKGTIILISIPCKIAIGIASFPEYLLIVANRISDEPMPAADIYYQIISFVLLWLTICYKYYVMNW